MARKVKKTGKKDGEDVFLFDHYVDVQDYNGVTRSVVGWSEEVTVAGLQALIVNLQSQIDDAEAKIEEIGELEE